MERKELFRALVLVLWIVTVVSIPTGADPCLGGIPLETVREGTVSGGIFVDAAYPMSTDGSATFVLPAHTGIQWARLYVVVYCGHMQNNYQTRADIEFNGGQGITKLATEILNVPYSFPGEGGSGPVRLSDHGNRVTSDYLMWYDVKDRIQGSNVLVRVKTSRPQGYTGTFDGRIKAIVLVAAYEDGDQDKVFYWVNQGHDEDSELTEEMLGETYVGETTFGTGMLTEDWDKAELNVVYLASRNAEYDFNGDPLPAGKPQGPYAGLDRHDVTDSIRKKRDSDLSYDNIERYFKIILATLAVRFPGSETGNLSVTSSPPGAKVSIDNEEQVQRTNATFSGIPAGNHVVMVEIPGFRVPAPQTVLVQTGETTSIHFTLHQGKGTITVETNPPGAEVFIDGVKHPALTPCIIGDIPAGEREVVIRLTGYREWREIARLSDGETLSLQAGLFPAGDGGFSTGEVPPATVQAPSGYRGSGLTLYKQGTLRGTLFSDCAGDYTGMIPAGQERTFILPNSLPGEGEIVLSRLYLYTTWSHDTTKREGVPAVSTVFWNGQELRLDAIYADRKGDGIYDYPVQTFAYDGKGVIKTGEKGTVTVRNSGETGREFATYGVLLVALVENPEDPEISYWICEGSDIVFPDPRFGTSAQEARTRVTFPGDIEISGIDSARLFIVSTAASGEGKDQNIVIFNGGEWYNLLNAGSSGISMADLDVRSYLLKGDNILEIASFSAEGGGDYMENRNAVLVLTHADGGERQTNQGEGTDKGEVSPGTGETSLPPGGLATGTSPTGWEPRSFLDSAIEWIFAHIFKVLGLSPLPAGEDYPIPHPASKTPAFDDLQKPVPQEQEEETGKAKSGETMFLSGNPTGDAETLPTPVMTESTLMPTGTNDTLSPEKPVTGGIFVTSYPGGAAVFIDGRKVLSKTPLVANWLKAGLHTVRVDQEEAEFTPDSRQVWVEPGEITPVSFTTGGAYFRTLTIESREFEAASFTVNGRGPVLVLPAKVTLEGHSPYVSVMVDGELYSQTIPPRIQDGSSFIFTREGGAAASVKVTSTPPRAIISIDGFPTKKVTPATIGNLSPGQHRIVVSCPGYFPAERLVTLVDFASEPIDMSVDLSLEPYQWGNLTVESDPPGARIYLFGKDTGRKTPATFNYLQIGSIQGKIRWDDSEKDFEAEVLPERDVGILVRQTRRE